jgi:hypothetical protein
MQAKIYFETELRIFYEKLLTSYQTTQCCKYNMKDFILFIL